MIQQRASRCIPLQLKRGKSSQGRQRQRGQTLVVIALLMTALIGMLGLVIDTGYAYSERRQIQNAADASALNGAREMDAQISDGNQVGADQQVLLAIKQYIIAYNLTVNTSGNLPASLQSAVYVDEIGSQTFGLVGAQATNQIPAGAAGVRVVVKEPWTPFFMSVLGFNSFTITATATAASGTIPGSNAVFVNCPPYNGSSATVNLILSGGGSGNPDTVNGSIFVNGSAKASGGTVNVSGTFGASGTITGNGINAAGGISQNQPPQQFPLPDVVNPLTTGGAPNTAFYNAGGAGVAAYTPPGNSYPEFDQEAFWDFYLGYNTNTLPSQITGSVPKYSGNYNNGDAIDMWFVVNKTPTVNPLDPSHVDFNAVLNQTPDVTQTSYFPAYQGHYKNNYYFHQWLQNIYANDSDPANDFPWIHWVDMGGSSNPSDPTTWYILTPTFVTGKLGFTAQTSNHPVNNFGGQCPYSRGCFPSGIWWVINWPSNYTCSGVGQPCIDMSSLGVAWRNPTTGVVAVDAGITIMTNVEFFYQSSASAKLNGWGFATTNHPVEAVYYYGWGVLGTLYVPRTVLYTTFTPTNLSTGVPADCSSTPPPEALHFNGSNQTINGFVMVPYGGITFRGSGANNLNGELFAAQVSFSGSGVTLTYDSKSAVKGDPGLIQ